MAAYDGRSDSHAVRRLIWQTTQIQNEICLNFPIEPDVMLYRPSVSLYARVSCGSLEEANFIQAALACFAIG
jgi:hypothetical protein